MWSCGFVKKMDPEMSLVLVEGRISLPLGVQGQTFLVTVRIPRPSPTNQTFRNGNSPGEPLLGIERCMGPL